MSLPDRLPASRDRFEAVAPVYSDSGGGEVAAPSRRALQLAAVIVGSVALLIVIAGLVMRSEESARLRDWTDAQAIPTVAVAEPGGAGAAATLNLPGRLEAYARAPLYARVSGYLKSWKYDIGAQVKAGQLLAEIEAPDLDQQLAQAEADLATAEANLALSTTTAQRWQSMLGTNAVSKQEVDEKTGDLAAKQALVKAARANVDRLRATEGFKRIVAPFDGVVTARQTDVGQLIQAGGGTGPELFEMSDVRTLRVYVSVPQNYVPRVPPGTQARLSVPEHPDKTYTATVESSSQSVTAASGTTLMQLAVDNAARELMPGSYAEVRLELPHDAVTLSIPASALIFDGKGLRVATVDATDHVRLKTIVIARDLGPSVEISSGLSADDRVVQSPPDGLGDGSLVRIAGNAARALAEDIPRGAHSGKDRNERS
jgi:RND family efflux transporter MFP subunit